MLYSLPHINGKKKMFHSIGEINLENPREKAGILDFAFFFFLQ